PLEQALQLIERTGLRGDFARRARRLVRRRGRRLLDARGSARHGVRRGRSGSRKRPRRGGGRLYREPVMRRLVDDEIDARLGPPAQNLFRRQAGTVGWILRAVRRHGGFQRGRKAAWRNLDFSLRPVQKDDQSALTYLLAG